MNEEEFINSVDCNFPYKDKPKWVKIVKQGCEISSNACFAVLHEICRPPFSEKVDSKELVEILNFWKENANHPLVDKVSNIATKIIESEVVSIEEAINLMNLISKYKNEYSALAIAYFSCNDLSGEVDKVYQNIISQWKEN